MSVKIKCNDFVRRQTTSSEYSHFAGTWAELEKIAEDYFEKAEDGYRDGVKLIPVPAGRFYCPGKLIEGKNYICKFEPRREGELSYLQVKGRPKYQAKYANLVVYRKDVLRDEATSDAEWEIVSINAKETEEEEPMNPITMARNFLELEGGTKGRYTAEEFAKAIIYWSQRGY